MVHRPRLSAELAAGPEEDTLPPVPPAPDDVHHAADTTHTPRAPCTARGLPSNAVNAETSSQHCVTTPVPILESQTGTDTM